MGTFHLDQLFLVLGMFFALLFMIALILGDGG